MNDLSIPADASAATLVSIVNGCTGTEGNSKFDDFAEGKISEGCLIRLDLAFHCESTSFRNHKWTDALIFCAKCMIDNTSDKLLTFIGIGSYSVYVVIDLSTHSFSCLGDTISSLINSTNESLNNAYSNRNEPPPQIIRTTTQIFSKTLCVNEAVNVVERHDQQFPCNLSRVTLRASTPLQNQHIIKDHLSQALVGRNEFVTDVLGDYDIEAHFDISSISDACAVINTMRKTFPCCRTNTTVQLKLPALHIYNRDTTNNKELLDLKSKWAPHNSTARNKMVWLHNHMRKALEDDINRIAVISMLPAVNDLTTSMNNGSLTPYSMSVLDAAIEALFQRSMLRSLPSADYQLALTNLSTGAITPLIAVEKYVAALYSELYSHIIDAYPAIDQTIPNHWKGFVVASASDGYQAYPHYMLTVPYDAFLEPCGRDVPWMVLSHEVSHFFATVLLDQPEFINCFTLTAAKLCTEYTGLALPIEAVMQPSRLHMEEISAHWLDYVYFYNSDMNKFFRSIWSTWSRLLQKDNRGRGNRIKNYLIRCFAIFVSAKKEILNNVAHIDYSDHAIWTEQVVNHEGLRKAYLDFVETLNASGVGPDYTRHADFDTLVYAVSQISPILKKFTDIATVSLNERISQDNDANSIEQDSTIENLLSGRTETISAKNTFIILREIQDRLVVESLINPTSEKNHITLNTQLAIMLSLANVVSP